MTGSACRSMPSGWSTPILMAVAGRRHAGDLSRAACLHARRDRLAQSAPHVPPPARRIGPTHFCESAAGIYDSIPGMKATFEAVPADIDALRAALIAERDRATGVEAELAVAKAKASDDQAVIAHQQLQIAKVTRALYGRRSERTVRLLDQIELAFEELERSATEDESAAERG